MHLLRTLAAVAAILLSSLAARADIVFVGIWDVAHPDAPTFFGNLPTGPLAYTGQEAAALLFGGSPGDYLISTEGDQVSEINYSAWYNVLNFTSGRIFAQDYFSKHLGLYYGPEDNFDFSPEAEFTNPASAFVQDSLSGLGRINYAFRASTAVRVSENGSTLLLFLSSGGILALLRRRFWI